jgi:dTMP kinase
MLVTVTHPLSANPSATALLATPITSTTAPTSSSSSDRGAFIVLEGVDRCGKTTQCGLLLEQLLAEGIPAVSKRFPDRTTTIGKMIDQYLTGSKDLEDHAIHLLFSANRWEGASQLEYHLMQKRETVICDRYAYSGVAFTSAKPRESQGGPLSFEWCQSPDIGLPAPDAVIFLDLSQEEAEQRGG